MSVLMLPIREKRMHCVRCKQSIMHSLMEEYSSKRMYTVRVQHLYNEDFFVMSQLVQAYTKVPLK